MSMTVPSLLEAPVSAPFSEATWQAWLLKGRMREERNRWRRFKAASFLSLVGIACAACAGFFPDLAPHHVPIRFAVAVGAVALLVRSLDLRRYTFAAAFTALAVLYNPVAPLLDLSGNWDRVLIALSVVPFIAWLIPSPKAAPMRNTGLIDSIWTIGALIVCGSAQAATAGDFSVYRSFRFEADITVVAQQTGSSAAQAKVIHSRPALIQELEWRPQPLGPSNEREAASEIVFRFLDGALYRVEVTYDRFEIEGLTSDDLIAAISGLYGSAIRPDTPKPPSTSYDASEVVVARWEDRQYRFDLVRASWSERFKLIGVAKNLDSSAIAAIQEAKRLDDREAPQRDAARRVTEQNAAASKLEDARAANKARFRP